MGLLNGGKVWGLIKATNLCKCSQLIGWRKIKKGAKKWSKWGGKSKDLGGIVFVIS